MSLKHKDYKEANIRFLEENLERRGLWNYPVAYSTRFC